MNYELNRELRECKKEQGIIQSELKREQYRIANLIKNQIGSDIKDVLNGKKIVKLSFKEKFNYKVKYILNKIFNTF